MIRQTHNLVLKDTSESEMARFRQFMLHVVRMQVEEGKAAAEWNQFIASEYGSAPENNQPKLSTSEVISKPKVSVPTKSQLKAKPKAAVKKQANLKPINQRGFVIAENGIRLHATTSPYDAQYKAKKGRYTTIYKKMDFVTIVHEDLDNKGWYKIKTLDGQYGYIEKKHIALVPYDEVLDKYTRTFLLVKPNYTFEINIANRLYPNYKHKTGDDRRTLAEAFYLLNKQSKHRHGVVLKEGGTSTIDKLDIAAKAFADPNFQKARALYDQLQLTSGYIVRIPTNEYINLQKKKGTLSQRSAIENFIIEMARAHQGFYEGFIYGLYSQIKDLVVGLWDLLKGILTGSLFKSIWDFVVKIWEGGLEGLKKFLNGITDAIGRNWNTFWKKFNSGNPRLQAYLIGELIAVVVFNIVLAIVTAGATVYLAATTKGAALLAKFPKIAKLVNKAIDAIPKTQRRLIEKTLKDKAGNVLKDSEKRILKKQVESQAKKEALERLNRLKKKNNSNPQQHAEFIDTPENLPKSKVPKKIVKKKTKKIKSTISDNWSNFTPKLDKEFAKRLEKFRGGKDKTFDSKLSGGEGQLFQTPYSDNLVLKRWFSKRVDDMPKSIRLLEQTKKIIESNPQLKKIIEVVDIKEKGSDWVVRGFDPDSIKIRDLELDPFVVKSRKKAIELLSKQNDEISKSILKKIEKNSANIHWSREKKKLLIIDMM
ncbi:hypothetical protein [Flavobacterium polysaccharolyticum]|uniref:SH3 domain-containing protein n=1 Tax=Flavobacterium polysaccharolyticum TaxID=3133148 RepID=A0ABU9NJ72_9FLAO